LELLQHALAAFLNGEEEAVHSENERDSHSELNMLVHFADALLTM
jgi:hypothetical protein